MQRNNAKRQTGRGRQKEEGVFLLITLAQSVLCAVMIGAAFVMSNLMGMTELKPAFSTLLTEETKATEVFLTLKDFAQSPVDEKAKTLLERIINELVGGRGGEQPLSATAPDKRGQRVVLSAKGVTPVEGRITSPFGLRVHPITGKPDFHTGVDISAPEGTEILAAYPGVVSDVGQSKIYGNYITLEHGGISTRYCHCQSILGRVGMKLREGERIATVGTTGVSTGPHLHFELLVDGVETDPLYALSI